MTDTQWFALAASLVMVFFVLAFVYITRDK